MKIRIKLSGFPYPSSSLICPTVILEPIRSDSPLLKMADDDRLYITPHISWASKEARTRLIGLVQKNIASYLEGGMENRVI
ncbi:hypothetical protein [Fusicatenibacter sp.]